MRLTKQHLRTYLKEHPSVVFKARDPWYCPIATAIQALNPRATNVVVQSEYIEWRVGHGMNHHQPTSQWQREFIERVDSSVPGYGDYDVTAEKAEAILAEVGK